MVFPVSCLEEGEDCACDPRTAECRRDPYGIRLATRPDGGEDTEGYSPFMIAPVTLPYNVMLGAPTFEKLAKIVRRTYIW